MKKVAILVAAVAFTLSLNMRVFATGVENLSNTEVNEATVITETVQEDPTEETEAVVGDTSTDIGIDEDINEDAGVLPDSIFYILDKAFDNFRLFLTFDDEKKMEIISQIADERLAESETMTKEEKYDLATSTMEEFNNLITKATDELENEEISNEEIDNDEIDNEEISTDEIENDEIENDEIDNDEIDNEEKEISELQLAKKAAVSNMVEKRHELNTARQENQVAMVDLKKTEKFKDEEAITAAEDELNTKEILYNEAKEAFYIAFAQFKETRNSEVKVEEVNANIASETKEEVIITEEKVEEEKVEEEKEKVEEVEEVKIEELKEAKEIKAKKVREIKEVKEAKEIREVKEVKEKLEKKETRNENEKKENNRRTNKNEKKENNRRTNKNKENREN